MVYPYMLLPSEPERSPLIIFPVASRDLDPTMARHFTEWAAVLMSNRIECYGKSEHPELSACDLPWQGSAEDRDLVLDLLAEHGRYVGFSAEFVNNQSFLVTLRPAQL